MSTQRHPCQLRTLVVAIHVLLGCTAVAHAETDPALLAQTVPANTVSVSVKQPDGAAAKANEWSGTKGRQASLAVGFELRGGGAYDSDNADRWQFSASDLGTQAADVRLDLGEQGRYRVRLGYNETLRNQSDSYRTPYLSTAGAPGVLTLPSSWLVPLVPRLSTTSPNARGLSPDVTAANGLVSGVSTAPTAAQASQSAAIQATDLPLFNQVDLYSTRKRASLDVERQLDEKWMAGLTVSVEDKTGVRAKSGHADSPTESSTPLPVPINQQDVQLGLSLGYTGEATQVRLSYDASVFTNNIPLVTWRLWSQPGNQASPTVASMSNGAPSNLFQKLGLSASHALGSHTRLQAHASYARTTQNEPYNNDPSSLGTMASGAVMPSSANALVVNRAAGLKLIDRSVRHLQLSASLKADDRQNRTAVNNYLFYDNNTTPSATLSPFAGRYGNPANLGSNVNINANTPYSKRVVQADLDADYDLGHGQHVTAGASAAKTHRYCLGSWIDCADAAQSREATLQGAWRATLAESVLARASLSSARRTVDYNENAFLARVPMAGLSPSTATGALAGTTAYGTLLNLGLSGYGRASGLLPAAAVGSAEAFFFPNNNVLSQTLYGNRNRIVEMAGLRRYDQADRDRQRVNASLSWQATEAWSLQAGLTGTQDRYPTSTYGLQKARSAAANLELSYNTDRWTAAAFATAEQQRHGVALYSVQTGSNSATANVNGATAISGDGACASTIQSRNASYKIDPCLNWGFDQRDRTQTAGLTLERRQLLQGKLDAFANVLFSDGRTTTDVAGGFYVNNAYAGITGAASRNTAAYFIQAAAMPASRARSQSLSLGGVWHKAAEESVRFSYGVRHLRVSDWAYDTLQPGGLAVMLPSFESAPNYILHTVQLSYVYSFR